MTKFISMALILTASVGLAFGQAKDKKQDKNAPAAPAQGAPAPPRGPQAKTQEEFKAYQDAMMIQDAVAMEAAVTDFSTKFPNSELKNILWQRLMSAYQNQNNADKTIEVGKKLIQEDPTNVAALVTVASVISNRTRDTDLDKEERWTEAKADANKAIEVLDSGKGIPEGVPADRADQFKSTIKSVAYAALGSVEFNAKNFAKAEGWLKKSTEGDVAPDPVSWLQLTLSLDRQNKYAEALTAANKCISIAEGHPAKSFCQQEQARLQKLAQGGGSATAPSAPASPQPGAIETK